MLEVAVSRITHVKTKHKMLKFNFHNYYKIRIYIIKCIHCCKRLQSFLDKILLN